MNTHIIECKDITFSYEKEAQVLHNINLLINRGESVGIIGANGAGKSTLLRILVGLELNFTGEVLVGQTRLHKKSLPQIRSQVGYLFQNSDHQLFSQNVYEDMAFGLRNYGMSEDQVQERVMQALTMTGIVHLKDKKIYKMSGGEKKMASIATVLAMEPEVILFDEPSIALDPGNRRKVIEVLNRLDICKIIASHDLDMVLDTCDRIVLMNQGQIICEGPAQEILTNKSLLEANHLELPLCYHSRP